jgi:hypothetical protein
VLALPHADAEVRGLARAAVALDAPSISTQLLDALDRDGVAVTWDRLIRPVLVAVGDRWEATGRGVDVEHLLSECALGALRTVALRALHANHAPPVLLACVPEEQHSLPLAALAAALGERNIPTRFLGARVPLDALSAAVRRLRPAVLVLFSQLPATADPGAVAAVPPLRPAVRVLLAGAGWHPHAAPPRAEFVADLPAAVERVSAALYRARANSNPAPDDAE